MASAAISGTRRAIREMADGTVRVQIDIDPECRRDFFTLFPEIDTRVAIAPLLGTAQAPETTAPPKGGELAKLAGILCNDPDFQLWIVAEHCFHAEAVAADLKPADAAAEIVRMVCEVKSRAELDNDDGAAARFHQRIRKPWRDRSAA